MGWDKCTRDKETENSSVSCFPAHTSLWNMWSATKPSAIISLRSGLPPPSFKRQRNREIWPSSQEGKVDENWKGKQSAEQIICLASGDGVRVMNTISTKHRIASPIIWSIARNWIPTVLASRFFEVIKRQEYRRIRSSHFPLPLVRGEHNAPIPY